tara:strand:- start:1002 stop:1226 length:225 start_codon:yes stop_codon:yes gene_type:complete
VGENFIWEVKYHIKFSEGDRYGSRDFDMTEVSSEHEAFDKLFEIYEIDEFSLVDGGYEAGNNELIIDEVNKIVI